MASALPLSSLRLLIPPLRLLTAAMWQVALQQSVRHFGMLEDFVSLVTEAVPQLLTERQRSVLLLALRAKAALCDPAPRVVRTHLEKIHNVSKVKEEVRLSVSQQLDEDKCSALSMLTEKLSESPADRRRLLQEVFNKRFDSALQSLVCDFLSRIEQLFPVPNFKQAGSWLVAAPGGVEDCLQEADREELKELLTNQSCLKGQVTATVGEDTEKILLSAWSHPLFTQLTTPDPPPTDPKVQSDAPLDMVTPPQLDVDLVKVEVVVMTEDEQEELDKPVVGQTESRAGTEESNEKAVQSGDKCNVMPLVLDADRLKDSPGNFVDQSGDTVNQSHQPCSEVTANALFSISHNSQWVAHKCPQCGKGLIYRSPENHHLRSSKSCALALTDAEDPQVQPGGHTEEPRPLDSRLAEPHPPKLHPCFECSAASKTKVDLPSQNRSQCDEELRHLSSLSNHKQTHLDRGGFTSSRLISRASESDKEPDIPRLQQQLQQQLPDLSCTVCDQTFSSQMPLLRHLQTHSVEGAEPSYKCRYCEQSFSGVTQLRIHQRTHTFRSYQCNQCSKMYSSQSGLRLHRSSHTNESRFLCPQCGKRLKTRFGLKTHLKTHTGERTYRCHYCPKDFKSLTGLSVHVRRHTGERPYVCSVCGKGCLTGGDLQTHMRTHTGERPFVCQDCGRAFSISSHLIEHRRIHTGEKPFSCPECGKCWRRKSDLKKHVLSHRSVRPYACVYCPKSYTSKTDLNKHLRSHREGEGGAAGAAEVVIEV